jgi:hypothetical protein
MKKLQRVPTRRQLLRATAVGAASIPFLALARKSASANQNRTNQNHNPQNSCLLKGTKISTPAGDRLVQDLQIGAEVQTLPVVKLLSGLATTNSQRKKAGLGRIA